MRIETIERAFKMLSKICAYYEIKQNLCINREKRERNKSKAAINLSIWNLNYYFFLLNNRWKR